MQIPKRINFRDLDSPPYRRGDAFQGDLELIHEFELMNPESCVITAIGIPSDEDLFDREILPGWEQGISDWFSKGNRSALYTYDFGDDWLHIVMLEEILPRIKGVKYPLCVDGARACPPEDCGGSHGYEDFLSIIMDPDHEEHDSMLEWAGGEFHPEHFDCSEVVFDDPAERLANLDADL